MNWTAITPPARRWGLLFDRIGVVRFRIIGAAGLAMSLAAGGLATYWVVHAERIGPIAVPLAVGGFALWRRRGGVMIGHGQ